jgi:Ca2+-transporting ATPase
MIIVFQGIFIGIISLTSFCLGNMINYKVGTTMAFVTLSFSQLFHSFNINNEKSIFNKKILRNKYLIYSFLFGLLFSILVIYLPTLAKIFQLAPLDFDELVVSVGLAFMIVVFEEFCKEGRRILKHEKRG